MTKAQILEELRRLPAEDRAEIRQELAQLDGDGWMDEDDPLSAEDKILIESRMLDHDKNHGTAVPWAEFRAGLQRRISL